MNLQKLSHSYTKIELKPLQATIRNILYLFCFHLFFIGHVTAQETEILKDTTSTVIDTVSKLSQIKKDTTLVNSDRVLNTKVEDSTLNDSTNVEKQLLTDKVLYKAKDYMQLSRKTNTIHLYNEAEVIYGDMKINSGLIIMNNNTHEVHAYGIKDSLGEYTQTPVFKQGQNVVEPDSIRFNFDTKKALIYNSRTEQSGFKIKNEVSKRENDSVIYMKNVKFTTSENIEDPEYYFYARRIKFVPKKKIITGLVNMFIADVPTPLGLPFGYFPLSEDRASGFIIPNYGEENNRGYFLRDGGYYFAISDYADLTVQGDYFTNASYRIYTESSYALRYRFRGRFSVNYQNNISEERGFPGFQKTTSYNISWSHNQDPKANPNSRFTASVNFGSSNFYQEQNNQQNINNILTNNINSSISYAKTFPGDPQVNVNVAATHNSNTNTQVVSMTLPNITANVSRVFPFAPKTGVKKGLIHNINTQYSYSGQNNITTSDDDLFTSRMFDNAQMGMQHIVPITTNFKVLKYLSASAGANYRENWVFETIEQSYDSDANDGVGEIVRDTIKGFDTFRTYSFSTSLGTSIYGTFNFEKDKKIQAIRHTMRPSISYTINPGFSEFYDSYTRTDDPNTTDINEEEVVEYSRFDGGIFGAPGNTMSSSISFSLSNTIEAKVKSKDSTATEPKKVTLLNNFSLSTAYNISGDSLQWSPVSMRGNIPIIQGKLDINFSATLDPYALDNNNNKIEVWNIDNGGSLFRLTTASANFGYSFSNKDFSKEKDPNTKKKRDIFEANGLPDDDLIGGFSNPNNNEFHRDRSKDKDSSDKDSDVANYAYKIPWSLRVSYAVNYNNAARQNEISNHTVRFSGDVELSTKWSFGVSSGYDFKNKGFSITSFNFQRDLESWRMSFNWIPFGPSETWSFFIGIKSSVLSDIKYDTNRKPDRRL